MQVYITVVPPLEPSASVQRRSVAAASKMSALVYSAHFNSHYLNPHAHELPRRHTSPLQRFHHLWARGTGSELRFSALLKVSKGGFKSFALAMVKKAVYPRVFLARRCACW